ncbi:MAG: hypothetical protein QXO86_04300 [Nitrososphaerota archaeon]
MDRASRGLVTVGLGLGIGVAPTLIGLALVAVGMASSPFVQGLMAELAGLFSVNLLLSLAASPLIVIGLMDFRRGIRARAVLQEPEAEEKEEIPAP